MVIWSWCSQYSEKLVIAKVVAEWTHNRTGIRYRNGPFCATRQSKRTHTKYGSTSKERQGTVSQCSCILVTPACLSHMRRIDNKLTSASIKNLSLQFCGKTCEMNGNGKESKDMLPTKAIRDGHKMCLGGVGSIGYWSPGHIERPNR